MMNHLQLELCLDELLASRQFKDYSPNGLQVEGRAEVQRIVTGVTACQALLDEAVRRQADAVPQRRARDLAHVVRGDEIAP